MQALGVIGLDGATIAAPPKRMQALGEPLVYEEQRALTLSLRHSVAFAASLFRTTHPSPTSPGTRQRRTSRTKFTVQTKKTVRMLSYYEIAGKSRPGGSLSIVAYAWKTRWSCRWLVAGFRLSLRSHSLDDLTDAFGVQWLARSGHSFRLHCVLFTRLADDGEQQRRRPQIAGPCQVD